MSVFTRRYLRVGHNEPQPAPNCCASTIVLLRAVLRRNAHQGVETFTTGRAGRARAARLGVTARLCLNHPQPGSRCPHRPAPLIKACAGRREQNIKWSVCARVRQGPSQGPSGHSTWVTRDDIHDHACAAPEHEEGETPTVTSHHNQDDFDVDEGVWARTPSEVRGRQHATADGIR